MKNERLYFTLLTINLYLRAKPVIFLHAWSYGVRVAQVVSSGSSTILNAHNHKGKPTV